MPGRLIATNANHNNNNHLPLTSVAWCEEGYYTYHMFVICPHTLCWGWFKPCDLDSGIFMFYLLYKRLAEQTISNPSGQAEIEGKGVFLPVVSNQLGTQCRNQTINLIPARKTVSRWCIITWRPPYKGAFTLDFLCRHSFPDMLLHANCTVPHQSLSCLVLHVDDLFTVNKRPTQEEFGKVLVFNIFPVLSGQIVSHLEKAGNQWKRQARSCNNRSVCLMLTNVSL